MVSQYPMSYMYKQRYS